MDLNNIIHIEKPQIEKVNTDLKTDDGILKIKSPNTHHKLHLRGHVPKVS
jgi:hypothetical protein